MKPILHVLLCALGLVAGSTSSVLAQGTAFTYQGQLNDGAGPANGIYDLRFALYDDASAGAQQGSPVTNSATAISNGLFTATLDFGNQFPGANRWLEIAVQTNGGQAFTTLAPRQPLTPAPYAITAGSVTSGGLAAGTYANAVTLNNAANSISGAFTGDGSGLFGVNAASLSGLTSDGFWKIGGNVGANPTNGAFIGTTDNLPLEFKVNGSQALRLESNGADVDYGSGSISPNLIGGYAGNIVDQGLYGAAILGGGAQGAPNHVGASYSVVLGGTGNSASGYRSTASGNDVTASGGASTAMGGGTTASGVGSFAVGVYTVASGWNSVAMCDSSTASGDQSFAAGEVCTAGGNQSFAAGNYAKALGSGDFVWNSFDNPNVSVGDHQFSIFGPHGLNVDFHTQRADGGGTRWLYIGDTSVGDTIATWNGAHLTDGGVWANASDKNRKTDFAAVSAKEILEKLTALPVGQWRYTNEVAGIKHLGPTAQDFQSAFGLGTDDKSIGTVDEGGVALAAIQGLNQKLEAEALGKDAEIAELKARLDHLEKLLDQRTK